jgi:hypothetical protein
LALELDIYSLAVRELWVGTDLEQGGGDVKCWYKTVRYEENHETASLGHY